MLISIHGHTDDWLFQKLYVRFLIFNSIILHWSLEWKFAVLGAIFFFHSEDLLNFIFLKNYPPRLPIAQNAPLSLMNERNLRQWQVDWLTYPIRGLISFEIYGNNVIKYNVSLRLNFVRQYELYSGC